MTGRDRGARRWARGQLFFSGRVAAMAVLVALPWGSVAMAQQADGQAAPMRASSRVGQRLFQQSCSSCHADAPVGEQGERQAPALTLLKLMTPERLVEEMTTGKMAPMAADLTPVQRQQVAEWVAGVPLGSAVAGDAANMPNRCAPGQPLRVDAAHEWRGWSPDAGNGRFQSAAAAGLSAADIPKLAVKWAFSPPTAIEMYSQPTVAGGRLFVSSDNAYVYALDPKSGCVHWSYRAATGVRNAPSFAAIPGQPGRYGVFFGDRIGNVYGVDALSGRELWRVHVDDHPRRNITGSPAIHAGRLYIGLSSGETIPASNPTYECCTSRGGVVAMDLADGRIVWKAWTIAEPLVSRGTNAVGTKLWGPSGAHVWNAPTIDAKRGVLYVGTGNGLSEPAASTSDSIVAFDLETGKMVWHHQEFSGDAYIGGCPKTSAPGSNCPTQLGPDWDFGGASAILRTLPDGRDVLVAAGKGGVAIGLDPDRQGKLLWRRVLYSGTPPSAGGLVVFGGAADEDTVYYPLQQKDGGLAALDIADGSLKWNARVDAGARGQAAAASVIPGAVFTGGWDGILRAVDRSGKVFWSYDTKQDYKTVNGVAGRGGSLGVPGPALADGYLYVVSGYIGPSGGMPGNVLIAMAPE